MALSINNPNDWLSIANIGGPVVDPMILRCGELFLRGQQGGGDSDSVWDLLKQNLHAIGTFFDRLVLDERIPVFNYADTFDMDQNFERRTLGQVNASEEILVDVNVGYGAYQEVRDAALGDLKRLYASEQARVDAQQAYDILGELTHSGYAWYPQLDDLVLNDPNEKRLASYILGGLIFTAYAQRSGADHLMQPKRSRLFLALSLNENTGRAAEAQLFEKLGGLVARPVTDIPFTPTFFPLLLAQSRGPAELLTNALALRKSPEVRDYRQWLRAALDDFDLNGRVSVELTRVPWVAPRMLEIQG